MVELHGLEFNKLRRCDIIGKIKELQIRHYLIPTTYLIPDCINKLSSS